VPQVGGAEHGSLQADPRHAGGRPAGRLLPPLLPGPPRLSAGSPRSCFPFVFPHSQSPGVSLFPRSRFSLASLFCAAFLFPLPPIPYFLLLSFPIRRVFKNRNKQPCSSPPPPPPNSHPIHLEYIWYNAYIYCSCTVPFCLYFVPFCL
jgi:hypothetical protein